MLRNEKGDPVGRLFRSVQRLERLVGDRLGHGAGADAAGADAHALHFAGLQLSANGLKIGHEAALGFVVGVADIIADLGSLPANFAYL
jgi:hypothetical protein